MKAMHDKKSAAWVVVLAAGSSRRLGKPKALLEFAGGKPFIAQLLNEYDAAGVKHAVVVVNNDSQTEVASAVKEAWRGDVTLKVNERASEGRFTSIRAGADAVPDGVNAFIQNIDNPFTTARLLRKMAGALTPGSYVAPVAAGRRGHPVLVSVSVLAHIRHEDGGMVDLRKILMAFPCIEIDDADTRIHANINTLEDYERWFANEPAR